MPYKGNYNKSGGSQKQQPSGDHRRKPVRRAEGTGPGRPAKPSRPVEPLVEKQPGLLTSSDNDKVRFVRNLLNKKDRYMARHFVVEGVRLVEEALNAPKAPFCVLYDADALAETEAGKRLLMRLIELHEDRKAVYPATERVLEFVSDTVTPQGVVAAVPFIEWQPEQMAAARLHIVLDELQDPGNLGTILRSAGAAGDTAVWLTEGSVDYYSPKVARAAMGAHFRVPVAHSQKWPELTEKLKEAGVSQILLADSTGVEKPGATSLPETSYYQVDWTKPTAIVIGNEAHGASAEAWAVASGGVSIPMPGGAESLNASVAASLIIYEALRHRSL